MIKTKLKKKVSYRSGFNKVIGVLVIPSLFISFILTIPLAYSIYISLRNFNLQVGINEFIGFRNYLKLFSDTDFFFAVGRNFIYSFTVVAFNFLIGFTMAILVNRKFKGSSIIYGIVILPMLLIPSAAATIWRFMYHQQFGIINHLISFLGFPTQPWLANLKTAFFAVILTDIWAWTPWVFLILLAGLQNIPEGPLEAAQIDGASTFQTFKFIVFPLVKPIIFVALTLKWIDTSKAFDYLWIMTSGGPGGSSHIISSYIYYNSFRLLDYGYGSALALVGGLLILLTSVIILTVFRKLGMPL